MVFPEGSLETAGGSVSIEGITGMVGETLVDSTVVISESKKGRPESDISS